MGDIFSPPSEATTTQTSTFKLPKFARGPLRGLLGQAEDAFSSPQQFYPGTTVPGQSPYTQQGLDVLGRSAGMVDPALSALNPFLTGDARAQSVGLGDVLAGVPGSAVNPLVSPAQGAYAGALQGAGVPGIGQAQFDQSGLGPIPTANFMSTSAPSADFNRAIDAAVQRALPGINTRFARAGGRNDPLAQAAVAEVASRAGIDAAQNQFGADLARANFLQSQMGRQFGADQAGYNLGLMGRQFGSDQTARQFQSDLQRQQALSGQSLARGSLAQFPLAQAMGDRGQLLGLNAGLLGNEQALQENALTRQYQTAAGLPAILSGYSAPLLQAGGIGEAREAAQLGEQAQRFMFNQAAPGQAVRDYANVFAGLGPLIGGTQTSTTTQPLYSSPLSQIAGLALGGASLFGAGGPFAGAMSGLGGMMNPSPPTFSVPYSPGVFAPLNMGAGNPGR